MISDRKRVAFFSVHWLTPHTWCAQTPPQAKLQRGRQPTVTPDGAMYIRAMADPSKSFTDSTIKFDVNWTGHFQQNPETDCFILGKTRSEQPTSSIQDSGRLWRVNRVIKTMTRQEPGTYGSWQGCLQRPTVYLQTRVESYSRIRYLQKGKVQRNPWTDWRSDSWEFHISYDISSYSLSTKQHVFLLRSRLYQADD